jgi:hypothetical protein
MTEHSMSVIWTDTPNGTAGSSAGQPAPVSQTPTGESIHEVPADLVETLAECWTRCRMAGLQRAKGERWSHVVGTTSTVVTAAAGTTVWATLQQQTDLAAQWILSVVSAVVVMAVGIERSMTKSYQDDAKVMDGLVETFHCLHVDLLAAASASRLTGAVPDKAIVDSAKKAVREHVASMSYERPTYDPARASVARDLRALGFYH